MVSARPSSRGRGSCWGGGGLVVSGADTTSLEGFPSPQRDHVVTAPRRNMREPREPGRQGRAAGGQGGLCMEPGLMQTRADADCK